MVNQIVNPVVGQKYAVTCLVHDCGPVPLSCDAHIDSDLNPEIPKHWHIDWRFVSDRILHALYEEYGKFNVDYEAAFKVFSAEDDDPLVDVELVCVRVAPPCMIPTYIKVLKRQYKSCTVDINSPVCPHRGVSLEVNHGKCIAICQGHGLAWNLRSGKMATIR